MSDDRKPDSIDRIKTGSFERRLTLTKAGLWSGSRMASHALANLFRSEESRAHHRKRVLSQQAQYLVDELGKLKGSVVKIGQMMAIYGEHFLPDEVTEALHTLEDRTTWLGWPVIRGVLERELGADRLAELEIEVEPIGAASLGQVHRAWRIGDGLEMVLKIQYPGVAEAVDADLDAVMQIMKLARVISSGHEFDDWLDEVRTMMHREVDYQLEAETTERFRHYLADDPRFIVPRILPRYSTSHVMASTFEPGFPLTAPEVQNLPVERRSALGKAGLELFLREIFEWGEIQTDPNFGNYRVRIAEDDGETDRLVLLDFGAVQQYPHSFLAPLQQMIQAAYERDVDAAIDGGVALRFMSHDWPREVLEEFALICMNCLEPLARPEVEVPASSLDDQGRYLWRESDLPTRVAKMAARSAVSRYFRVPPREFVFLNRKLIGVYTLISVLGSAFQGREILLRHLYRERDDYAADLEDGG